MLQWRIKSAEKVRSSIPFSLIPMNESHESPNCDTGIGSAWRRTAHILRALWSDLARRTPEGKGDRPRHARAYVRRLRRGLDEILGEGCRALPFPLVNSVAFPLGKRHSRSR